MRYAFALMCSAVAACDGRDESPGSSSWHTLPEPSGRLLDGFTWPHSVVERDMGIVLVSDRRHREIWRADFERGTRTPFGRLGDGPGEFRHVHQLLPLAADSLAVLSFGVPGRIAVLSSDGRPARTLRLTRREAFMDVVKDFDEFPMLTQADATGRLYGARVPSSGSTEGIINLDTVPIMRSDARTATIDTVALFALGESGELRWPRGDERHFTAGRGYYAARNDWVVMADGTIVMVDASDYALHLVPETGPSRRLRVRHGHPRYAVDVEQWKHYIDSSASATRQNMRQFMNGVSQRMRTEVKGPGASELFRVPAPPEFWSPVRTAGEKMRRANGLLWIPVTGAATPHRKYWDVVSLDGEVKRSFIMDSGRYLLEVTPEHIYTFTIDDDDLRWVSRHPNPMR